MAQSLTSCIGRDCVQNSRAPDLFSPVEIRAICPLGMRDILPGTEIFAAETGEPKSGQETSSVRRDPGPGTRPANMAEETALLGVCLEAGISGRLDGGDGRDRTANPPRSRHRTGSLISSQERNFSMQRRERKNPRSAARKPIQRRAEIRKAPVLAALARKN